VCVYGEECDVTIRLGYLIQSCGHHSSICNPHHSTLTPASSRVQYCNRLLDTASFTLPRKCCWKTSGLVARKVVSIIIGKVARSVAETLEYGAIPLTFLTPVATSTNRTVSPRVGWGPLIRSRDESRCLGSLHYFLHQATLNKLNIRYSLHCAFRGASGAIDNEAA
jgi:hypothetical protein